VAEQAGKVMGRNCLDERADCRCGSDHH
jgi:hypothetical protein